MKTTVRTKFEDNPTKVPLVKIGVASTETPIYALIDTGAEVTLFGQELEQKNLISPVDTEQNISLIGFAGEKDTSVHIGNLLAQFGDTEQVWITFSGLVSDLSFINKYIQSTYHVDYKVSALLGSDFLTKFKAKINYRTKDLTLHYDLSSK